MENTIEKTKLLKVAYVLGIILSVFFGLKAMSYLHGGEMKGRAEHTITLTGHGEVTAVPDIANVSFSISKDAKTAKDAQAAVALVEKKALDAVKANGVADKDIKTSNASVYPKYTYTKTLCPQVSGSMMPVDVYCSGGNQVISGYTASESITVKVRAVDSASKIMQDLGIAGVSDLSGPNFAIDNEDGLKAEARKKAIDDARAQAVVLAKDLGVRLGRVSSFSESGGGYPMYYAKDAMMGVSAVSAPTPAELPKGENTISSDVTITYEIR